MSHVLVEKSILGRQLLKLGYLSKGGLNGVISADSTFRTFPPSMLTVDCLLPSSHHLLHASQRTRSPMVPWAVKSPLDYLSLHLLTLLILLPNGIWLERSHTKRMSMSHASVSRRAGFSVGLDHGSMLSA